MAVNPETAGQWKRRITEVIRPDPENLLLQDLSNSHSASKLTEEEFLHLKILWATTAKSSSAFRLREYVDEDSVKAARDLTRTSACKRFCKDIGDIPAKYSEQSIFSLAKLYQKLVSNTVDSSMIVDSAKVIVSPPRTRARAQLEALRAGAGSPLDRMMGNFSISDPLETPDTSSSIADDWTPQPDGRSPSDPSEFAPSEDETLVNTAFILLLNALTERTLDLRNRGYRWLPNRDVLKIFSPSPPVPGNDALVKLLEARTDGCLRRADTKLSAAIVEVKPYLREAQISEVERQEGAQMAAYIATLLRANLPAGSQFGLLRAGSPRVKRRLLFSQDHHEVYITIAEYDAQYESFLLGNGDGVPHTFPQPDFSRRQAPAVPPGRVTAQPAQQQGGGTNGFLVMNCYGPWDTGTTADLESLCENICALTWYLSKQT